MSALNHADRAREIIGCAYSGVDSYAFESRDSCREFIKWVVDQYLSYWMPCFEWASAYEPAKFYGVRLTFITIDIRGRL